MKQIITLLLLALACVVVVKGDTYWKAISYVRSTGSSPALFNGTVWFERVLGSSTVTITGTFVGLPIGVYGLHVHYYGDISAPIPSTNATINTLGGHFNPHNLPHGCYPDPNRHTGDVGNITVTDASMPVTVQYTRDLIDLTGTVDSIVGRGVVVHATYDNCQQPTGNAGAYIGQGVIGIQSVNASDVNNASVDVSFVPTSAIAKMYGVGAYTGVSGSVSFSAVDATHVRVVTSITGLVPNSVHAYHVHTFGDDSDMVGALSAGGHFNPNGGIHAGPNVATRHAGDMGNVTANGNGAVYTDLTFDLLSLTSYNSIVGRSVVLHALFDDGNPTQSITSTGSAGARVAIGIIGFCRFPAPSAVMSSSGQMMSSSGQMMSSSGQMMSSSGQMMSSSGQMSSTAPPSNGSVHLLPSVAVLMLCLLALFFKF